MTTNHPLEAEAAVDGLVDEYRARCLWFVRLDYYPRTTEERLRALDYIGRHGTRSLPKGGEGTAMALPPLQRGICRLIARNRIESGASYVAGGASLNELTRGSRISRDVDLFHDTEEALGRTWAADRALLDGHGYSLRILRERLGVVEAEVSRGGESVLLQWTRDSAFRFFPLVEHDDLGLTLHPFNLATNKVLALVGRLEVRDWVDVLLCHQRVQPLGYLAWAACGKDPGFSPMAILEHAARSSRYSADDPLSAAPGRGPDRAGPGWHQPNRPCRNQPRPPWHSR